MGVIVTRGPDLQNLISRVICGTDGVSKYGTSTTHWDKLLPRINLGGGGECPLLLIGIQPERIEGIELAQEVRAELDAADRMLRNWREEFDSYDDARAAVKRQKDSALARLIE